MCHRAICHLHTSDRESRRFRCPPRRREIALLPMTMKSGIGDAHTAFAEVSHNPPPPPQRSPRRATRQCQSMKPSAAAAAAAASTASTETPAAPSRRHLRDRPVSMHPRIHVCVCVCVHLFTRAVLLIHASRIKARTCVTVFRCAPVICYQRKAEETRLRGPSSNEIRLIRRSINRSRLHRTPV